MSAPGGPKLRTAPGPALSKSGPVHSTETLLPKIHNDKMVNLGNGDVMMLFLLDLSAALDNIYHDILLARLRNRYGLQDLALPMQRRI